MIFSEYFINEPSARNFPEKFLYHIWDEQHLKCDKNKTLKTVSGNRLTINFQGHYNTFSGADFKNALLQIDDNQLSGDVEIHLFSSDWYHHQHDTNPAYNSVVLHVVLKHNHHLPITLNEKNEQIEILVLEDIISDEIEKLFKKYSENDYQFNDKYCALFSSIRPEFFDNLLVKSGLERLEKKIKRFEAELSFVSIDQLFYQSIFESLGYSKNKTQFYLFSKENNWLYYKQKNLSLEDFVHDLINKADFESNKYNWYLFRIRPQNHPKNRIYQIATFIYNSFSASLTSEIAKMFSFTEDDFTISKLETRIFTSISQENYFSKYKIGKNRVRTMIVNIFIPLMMIYSNYTNDKKLNSLCKRVYLNISGLELNNICTLMKKYMTKEQFLITQKKAVNQQGLLNIYYKYCINHMCSICKENMLNSVIQEEHCFPEI